jgi:hypothetical protein
VQLNQQSVEVERLGGHSQLPADPRPFVSWTVAIKLKTVAIRVAQVNGFTDAVIGSAFDGHAMIEQALESAREFAAGWIENGEVVKPRATGWRLGRAFAGSGVEGDVMVIPARREKNGAPIVMLRDLEPERVTIEPQRALEV